MKTDRNLMNKSFDTLKTYLFLLSACADTQNQTYQFFTKSPKTKILFERETENDHQKAHRITHLLAVERFHSSNDGDGNFSKIQNFA